jgi:uncharacterized protein
MEDNFLTKRLEESFSLLPGKCYLHEEIDISLLECLSWRKKALEDFSKKLADDKFPCVFARKAWNNASIRFLFCEKQGTYEYSDFLSGLIEYTKFVRDTEIEKRLFSPLVVFFSEDFYQGTRQHSFGWDALNWVHRHDPDPWPQEVPLDPDNSDWCFCFNSVQLFINMSVDDHKILRSRNLGNYLTLVINPRKNFDVVASIHTKSGRLIREHIRSRISTYNGGVVPKELGSYGEKDNREWQQYQLSEDGLEKPSRCPFHTSNEKVL